MFFGLLAKVRGLLFTVYTFFASGFGLGRLTRAPGTLASLAFVLFWLCMQALLEISWITHFFFVLCLSILAFLSCWSVLAQEHSEGAQEEHKQKHGDPSWVVIDEWLGMYVALLPLSGLSFNGYLVLYAILAFALFRLFDIWKPGLIGRAEKLPGAVGVLADDVLAGIISAGILCLPVHVFA